MKKYGKYETKSEGIPVKQPKVKSALLQTYLTSLLCMVLCVTMFFGTSYAWFTSEVTNTGNEIYIGKLDVGLFAGSKDLSVATNKLFDSTNIRWEPGYTALETIKVVDEGDLAFKYALNFIKDDSVTNVTQNIETVAACFEVWIYDHQQNNGAPTPGSYADIKAENGWKPIGTLADVLSGKTVLEGEMEEKDVVGEDPVHTYTIALHMKKEVSDATVMGQKIGLTVKLVAHQLASEQDGFGNSDYDNIYSVSTAKELQEALDNATGNAKVDLSNDITGDITAVQKEGVNVVIDGNGKTLTGSILVDGKSTRPETAGLTIQNVVFTGVSGAESSYIYLGKKGDSNTRYTNNVTVKDCTFQGVDLEENRKTAAVRSFTGGDKNLVIAGCTVDEKMHSLLQVKNVEEGLKIVNCVVKSKNGANLNNTYALEMSGCTFDVEGYAVRFGEDSTEDIINTEMKNFTISSSTLKSACEDGDAVIIFRDSSKYATLTLTNTSLVGTTEISGDISATTIIKN